MGYLGVFIIIAGVMFVLLLLLLLLGWLCESCWICLDILRREWERL